MGTHFLSRYGFVANGNHLKKYVLILDCFILRPWFNVYSLPRGNLKDATTTAVGGVVLHHDDCCRLRHAGTIRMRNA